MNSPLLQINNLSVRFGNIQALQDISLEINRGEIVAIVGESGSGKSVTALSILQLLPAVPIQRSEGEILFFKEENKAINLLQLPVKEMEAIRGNEIAMIFQEPMTSLNPVLTCGEQVMEAIQLHQKVSKKIARQRTIELFKQVRLPDPERLLHRYPHQLSGGQKQRVMIAIAMCCHPSLLICDEPTTALDITVEKAILQLIKELQQQSSMSVIFITHDLGVVKEIADRVIVMYKGKIVETNTTQNIFTSPQHPYTKALLACRPALHPKGERLPVVSDFMMSDRKNTAGTDVLDSAQLVRADVFIGTGETPAPAVPDKSDILMKVENLSVWYPAQKTFFWKTTEYTKAVDDVSFEILQGETLGLVGESGCGKSTLGRALLRMIEPVSGTILFKGKNITSYTQAELRPIRKNMQLIFQDPYSSLNPSLAIGSAIMEPLKVHGLYKNDRERREKVIELLEKVSLLPEHFKRYPHEFSGGQRQRIVIARALALQPSFIICDESVSALDVSVQAQVLNLLNDLKKEFGFTTVFISHDPDVVRYMCDRVLEMSMGKIIGN